MFFRGPTIYVSYFKTIPQIISCRTISGNPAMSFINEKTYINGKWIPANSNKLLEVTNPVNGDVVGKVPDMDVTETQVAIDAAIEAFKTWQFTTGRERAQLLRKWYHLVEENKDHIATIMTAESGKPLSEALGEIAYGNSYVEWFSEQARNIRGEIIPSPLPNKKMFVEHAPIGVVGLITPWNFPHAMIARKAAAALAAGCTCVIKPAEDTPLTALALMKYAEEAGIPPGVLNVVTSSRQNTAAIGALLCESPKVHGISFTGSTVVGKILYRQCANRVKRLALELGGNAPFIVYNSADMNKAVEGAMISKFRNCGQACVASNRFLIQEEVYDKFVPLLVERVKQLNLGDGKEPGVHIGPLINEVQFNKISDLVNDAVSKGAKVLIGGKPAPYIGKLFYEPTVLVDINSTMKVYHEEVFGPVINIMKFKTEEESMKIANNTNSGLAGYFFSEDVAQIFRVSEKLEVGMVGVNEGLISAAEAPFGGVKESGLGREGSHHGIEDFVFIKYICIGGLPRLP